MLADVKNFLRKSWTDDARQRPFRPSLTIEDEGLILGAGTVLAPMAEAADGGAPTLAITGREERLLALLSIGLRQPIRTNAIYFVRRAAKQWAKGEKALAHFELAFAGLPKLDDDGWRLFYADGLMKFGLSPRSAMICFGLDAREFDLLKYAPDQPRVPAGSGRESGRWASDAVGVTYAPAPSSPASASKPVAENQSPESLASLTVRVAQSPEPKSAPAPHQTLSDVLPDPVLPGQQYAQSTMVKDLATGTQVAPYGELARSFADLPENTRQILQFRFFVQDDKTGEWHVGFRFPASSEVRDARQTRGQGAGIDESGFLIRPPGSPELPETGSNKKPESALRFGYINKDTKAPYFRVYNSGKQPISPVTGRTVDDDSPLGHYPLDPFKSGGPRYGL